MLRIYNDTLSLQPLTDFNYSQIISSELRDTKLNNLLFYIMENYSPLIDTSEVRDKIPLIIKIKKDFKVSLGIRDVASCYGGDGSFYADKLARIILKKARTDNIARVLNKQP